MYKKGMLFIIISILMILQGMAWSQTMPTHSRLLFSDDLTSGGTKSIGTLSATGGSFSSSGWTTTGSNSKLRIDLKEYLPFDCTVEVTIKGFNASNVNFSDFDWAPISLYSRLPGNIRQVGKTPGAYIYLKSDQYLNAGDETGFYFYTAPFHGDLDDSKPKYKVSYPVAKVVWNKYNTYVWKIAFGRAKGQPTSKSYVWIAVYKVSSTGSLSLVENGLKVHLFDADTYARPLYETFAYIFLGRDDLYNSIPGITYRELKIYGPATPAPFLNVARSHKVDADQLLGSQGLAISDINNDGIEDILIGRYHQTVPMQPNLLYVGQADNTYLEESETRGVATTLNTVAPLYADFNLDGYQDIFMGNIGQPNKLFFNNGSGIFMDVSSSKGILNESRLTDGCTIIDVENDGDPDIVAVNEDDEHEVYINNGSGSFSQEYRGLEYFIGTTNSPFTSAAAGDLTGDGYQDLVLVRSGGNSLLLINDGYGHFSEESSTRGFTFSGPCNSASLADYDNDGDLDIFIPQRGSSSIPFPLVGVFENDGTGEFTNVSSTANITTDSYGISIGDWDNDTKLDIYSIQRNDNTAIFFFNNGNRTFSKSTYTGGEIRYKYGRGSAVLDFNDDGHLDIYGVSYGDEYSAIPYSRNYLLQNMITNSNHYFKVVFYNNQDAVAGLGSKVFLYEPGYLGNAMHLIGYREVSPVSAYYSQNSWIQHFGVGTWTNVDIKVLFPNGKQKTFTNRAVDQTLALYPDEVIPEEMIPNGCSQQGKAGKALTEPVSALVIDKDEMPASGVPVTFKILAGNGTINNAIDTQVTVNTGADGFARVSWYMGRTAGVENRLEMSCYYLSAHLPGSPHVCSITPTAGDAAILQQVSGNNQSHYINNDLPNPLVVKVTDAYGNVVSGHPVDFEIIQGDGSLNGLVSTKVTVSTNSSGLAEAIWHLGMVEGTQKVRATSTYNSTNLTNSPMEFTATATVPPRILYYQSGNNQTGQVNTTLQQPFVVKLVDGFGVPLDNQTVTFAVVSGGGSYTGLQSIDVQTNSIGLASITAVLGTVAGDSNNVFSASSVDAALSPVIFKATAIAGPAYQLTEVSGNGQSAPVHQLLPESFVVRLEDAYSNPLPDRVVNFNVTVGNGQISGLSSVQVYTTDAGLASVVFRVGTTIGTNVVAASAPELPGVTVTFSAESIIGLPARIDKISGDEQQGSPNMQLPLQLVVAVRDSFYNPIQDHVVSFTVTKGGGNLSGQTTLQRVTNMYGEASVPFTLGPKEFRHEVTATSYYNNQNLINSPLIFVATTGPSDPDSLIYVSGNNQIGAINDMLTEPFVVRIFDKNGLSTPNQDVQFITYSQGAHFSGKSSIIVKTDADGYAAATASLGSDIGENNYIFEVIAKFNNVHLKNSPMQFYASGRLSTATKLEYVSGNGSVGIVGTTLTDPLRVRALNQYSQPIENHPVNFEITSGDSVLNNRGTSITVMTSSSGIAEARVLLGSKPGVSKIQASAEDGLTQLQGSPIEFQVTAIAGPPSPKKSTLNASSPVIANSINSSLVTVTLRDAFGNRLKDKVVSLYSSGIEVVIVQPATKTDINGQTTGSVKSINTGIANIWAVVDGQIIPSDTITFIPGSPSRAVAFNSDQIAETGKQLENPIGVQIFDTWNHPTPGIQVTFAVKDGQGQIVEQQPVLTNSEGKASSHWVLGGVLGAQHAIAMVTGIGLPVEFVAYAIPPNPASIQKVSGNQQIGYVNTTLPQLLFVAVKDSAGQPLSNVSVSFELIQGFGVGQGDFISPNPALTDKEGKTSAIFKAGSITGLHKVRARLASYENIYTDFEFIIFNQKTLFLERIDGNHQTVRPQTNLQIGVRVKDYYGTLLVGEQIEFTVTAGEGGQITTLQPATTNASGVAIATWVTGNSGEQAAQAAPVNADGTAVLYTATVLNSAPMITSPVSGDMNVNAGNLLNFVVNAYDVESDQITYSAQGLPPNAAFDPVNTHIFSWTPTVDQAGEHAVTFTVTDLYGASSQVVVNIIVTVVNHCPEIIAYSPLSTVLSWRYNEMITFKIYVDDPDGDKLTYMWKVNNFFGGDKDSLKTLFTQDAFPNPSVTVQAIVSDGFCADTLQWNVYLETTVDLVSFEAQARHSKIELHWVTKKEKNNLGFFLLRSERASGPFRTVNENVIASQSSGKYLYVDENVTAGTTVFYKLKDVDRNGRCSEHGPISITVPIPSSIDLTQNYPNPFNPTTRIMFELPELQETSLVIYNIAGQIVRTLVNGRIEAGTHEVQWDGTNEQGVLAPSGIYYYQLRTRDVVLTKKLILLK